MARTRKVNGKTQWYWNGNWHTVPEPQPSGQVVAPGSRTPDTAPITTGGRGPGHGTAPGGDPRAYLPPNPAFQPPQPDQAPAAPAPTWSQFLSDQGAEVFSIAGLAGLPYNSGLNSLLASLYNQWKSADVGYGTAVKQSFTNLLDPNNPFSSVVQALGSGAHDATTDDAGDFKVKGSVWADRDRNEENLGNQGQTWSGAYDRQEKYAQRRATQVRAHLASQHGANEQNAATARDTAQGGFVTQGNSAITNYLQSLAGDPNTTDPATVSTNAPQNPHIEQPNQQDFTDPAQHGPWAVPGAVRSSQQQPISGSGRQQAPRGKKRKKRR